MALPAITALGAVNEQVEPEVPPVALFLRLALPQEGSDDAQMQILVQTENGLEMKCFQYYRR